ncbi:MAG: HAD family hydrolase [Ktedonobacteraceae bacterium]
MPKKSIPALSGRTIRCILFDLGDTLWSRKDMAVWQRMEEAAHVRAAVQLQQRVVSPFLSSMTEVELGQRLRASVEENLRKMLRQDPDFEPDGSLAVIQTLAQWGIPDVERSTGEIVFEELRVRIPGSRPLFDDVLPTLKTLRQRGFQLGVVTNRHWGGELFQQDLQTLGLLEYFDPRHMAISVDLGVRKPNSAIFLHALNALNIPPAEAVMVGDSLLSDIVGSKMLGIFSVWKPKPSVRSHAQLLASGAVKANQLLASSPERVPAGHPRDLPPGMHITDDDYVLAQVQSRAGKWDEHLHSEVKPDLIIENLHDLLDIFLEVGEQ